MSICGLHLATASTQLNIVNYTFTFDSLPIEKIVSQRSNIINNKKSDKQGSTCT